MKKQATIDISKEVQNVLFTDMLRSRMVEEKMLNLLRQGKISKWFSGIGQEAISVGVARALQQDDFVLPMHRNLGVFLAKGVPYQKLFKQWQGKVGGFSKGRDRSFHFGSVEHRIVGMISHLGPQMGVACGLALAAKLKGDNSVVAVFTGDGGTSEGDFHEAMNVAAVWDLPILFIIENNGYGLSTPVSEQYKCKDLCDRAVGYGMVGQVVEGNDVEAVYQAVQKHAAAMRKKAYPVLLECKTFRMRGHEEASGTKYVPDELLREWEQKDPVENYMHKLVAGDIINTDEVKKYREVIKQDILDAWSTAVKGDNPEPGLELADNFYPYEAEHQAAEESTREIRFVDAVSEGLRQAMEAHHQMVIMGQDVADYGGVFKVTDGFVEAFGKERVRNTPLCESAILSAAVGLSIKGYKSVVEMQFADFVSTGFTAIVNNIAKLYYRWGQNVDTVIRMPTGAGVGAGPFHSQSNEAWFFKVPGLKIVYPATAYDAKGLLLSAVNDPNPVMFFEHKLLYRSESGAVPEQPYTLPIGKANTICEGNDISIITYGMGVRWAKELTEQHAGVSFDILDLCSLCPLDKEAILASVRRTGKVVVLHEDTLTGGIGAEVAAQIGESAFQYLDGPIIRVGSLDTPVPFAAPLEKDFLPVDRFAKAVKNLLAY